MIKAWMQSSFTRAFHLNRANILSAVIDLPRGKMLDLGCDDGIWTEAVARQMNAGEVHAVEMHSGRAAAARERGILVKCADLAQALPYNDSEFDFVHANQVIEHVTDVDLFASEIHRVLKMGRIAVISTENASSWHNVIASALGWQMFSLTNMSMRRLGIGNPLALRRGAVAEHEGHIHRVIFSYRGLIEFFEAHGFEVLRVRGAGYYPWPAWFGRLDVRHAAYLTATLRKCS
jgi:2-polyprenyl-3-methyl-5-hydroxy-6-metoxy-1,4-benzoquinol methylase